MAFEKCTSCLDDNPVYPVVPKSAFMTPRPVTFAPVELGGLEVLGNIVLISVAAAGAGLFGLGWWLSGRRFK